MEFIDAHAHLEHPRFDSDREQVIERAKKAFLIKIVEAGSNYENNLKVLSLHEKHPEFIECVIGCSPHDANRANIEAEIALVKKNSAKIVGIGEIGLEYHYFREVKERKKQVEVFEAFLNLSQQLKKPVVIHTREAKDEAVLICAKFGVKTLMHCTTDPLIAQSAVSKGFTISVPTLESRSKKKVIEQTPLEQLVCETDSPFLWRKGERNEPSNVVAAYKEVAEAKGLSLEKTAQQLTLNAKLFYNI